MDEWQSRYDNVDKGEWTKFMLPSVRLRCSLPLVLDHYTTQFLTGHGDFRAKLHKFNLSEDPICACDRKPETVKHMLIYCPRTRTARLNLIKTLRKKKVKWPPEAGAFLKSRKTYEALRTFATLALTNRTDR